MRQMHESHAPGEGAGAQPGSPEFRPAGDRRWRRPTTLQDLADHLRLSKGTVSRALNGYPDISPHTRQRVEEAARRFDYSASAPARAIRTGRSESVGLVLNVDEDNAYKPFLSDFLDGISRRLGQEGWVLSVATAFSSAESLAAHSRLVAERKVDGFILPRTKREDDRVRLLEELSVPFVLYGRTASGHDLSWYDIRGEDAMAAAVARLAGLGHERIAFLGAPGDNMFQCLRREGFRRGLRAVGLAPDPELETEGAMSLARGAAATRALLARARPPTAIVCAVDRAALGACRAISELGLVPGRDVSVIGYDGIPEGAHAEPPLTTFAVDNRQAGYRLADMLIRRIAGEPAETLREEVAATLIERRSDGPPARTPEQIASYMAELMQEGARNPS